MDATKQKFERHWREYCSDADLDWLVHDAKCKFLALRFLCSQCDFETWVEASAGQKRMRVFFVLGLEEA